VRENNALNVVYTNELIWAETTKEFLGSIQNYPLLEGQRNNLYKCILANTFQLSSKQGFIGLVHPEGIYDDPKGQLMRKEVFQRLAYHFQFKNELKLFSEIDHHNFFGVHIYSGKINEVDFESMNNLFHPSTIDASFIHNGHGVAGGIKIKDETGALVWNIKPHKDRIVRITRRELEILAKAFEDSDDWETTQLVSIHVSSLVKVIEKFAIQEFKFKSRNYYHSDCWNETNAVKDGIIKRHTKVGSISELNLIFSGPHFYVSNPLYKSARTECKLNSDYDVVELKSIPDNYFQKTNYMPALSIEEYRLKVKSMFNKNWLDHFKVLYSGRMSLTGERSLQCSIVMPGSAHIHALTSFVFDNNDDLINLCGLSSSLVFDFYIRTLGKSGLYGSTISSFPLPTSNFLNSLLKNRTLILNCLNKFYAPLWEESWQEAFKSDSWSKQDTRLKPFNTLTPNWKWSTPLRNWFERRQALVEIDVITAMALGLTLEELILIYNIQFPVLQQNEDDTWYDTKGNIVFTCSKGLVGVGVDRKEWEQIRNLQASETYEHTITKSELYQGKKITYHAPFDKCDRVEDYKTAWKHFEEVFKEK
jgi:hypothetical protein